MVIIRLLEAAKPTFHYMVAGQLRLSYHEGIDIVVSIPSQIEEAIAWLKENDVPTRKKFFGDEEITIEDLSH